MAANRSKLVGDVIAADSEDSFSPSVIWWRGVMVGRGLIEGFTQLMSDFSILTAFQKQCGKRHLKHLKKEFAVTCRTAGCFLAANFTASNARHFRSIAAFRYTDFEVSAVELCRLDWREAQFGIFLTTLRFGSNAFQTRRAIVHSNRL